jgi:DNA-binding NarL/FixJ family response regulator
MSLRLLQIMCMTGEGMTKQEIANKLFISINTVKTHRTRLGRALDVPNDNDAALVVKAFEMGILQPLSEDPCVVPVMDAYGMDVLEKVSKGMRNEEIAEDLGRSLHSVKCKIGSLLKLWAARNRTHLTYLAYMSRLMPYTPDGTPLAPQPQPHMNQLTNIEYAVIRAVASGKARDQIGAEMNMSHGKVMRVISDINAKFDTRTTAHAVAAAYKYGYLTVNRVGPPTPLLDRRTIHIIEHIARGHTVASTAARVGETESSVKTCVAVTCRTLRAKNRAHLVNQSFQTGNLVLRRKP